MDSQDLQDALWRRWLGDARSDSYLMISASSKLSELALHNQRISSALMEDVSHIEIALGNVLSAAMEARFSSPERSWLDDPMGELAAIGGTSMVGRIGLARKRLLQQKKSFTDTDLVAELSLGFWVILMSKRLLPLNIELLRAFSGFDSRNLPKLRASLNELKNLRNRVAHQHRVIHRDLESDYRSLITLAKWIHPDLGDFVRDNSRVLDCIAGLPK
jgi:hypothetical protein